jgi:hypothetical protein
MFRTKASVEILSDHPFMLKACELLPQMLQHVHPTLSTNRGFLRRLLLDLNPNALAYVSLRAQEMFPDLIWEALTPYSDHLESDKIGAHRLIKNIAPELRNNSEFQRAWFYARLP